jgi:hypothetical protein
VVVLLSPLMIPLAGECERNGRRESLFTVTALAASTAVSHWTVFASSGLAVAVPLSADGIRCAAASTGALLGSARCCAPAGGMEVVGYRSQRARARVSFLPRGGVDVGISVAILVAVAARRRVGRAERCCRSCVGRDGLIN